MRWNTGGKGREKGEEELDTMGGAGASETNASKDETREGLSFGWRDVLALSIAFFQVIFLRVVITVASFAAVIWLLGKFWLKCW